MAKKLEELSPKLNNILLKTLGQYKKDVEELLSSLKQSVEQAPEGSLRLSKSHGILQFYHKTKSGPETGKYIPRSEQQLAEKLAQKEYNSKAIKELTAQLNEINNFERKYTSQNNKIQKAFTSLNKHRKPLVNPLTLTDSDYIEKWNKIEYTVKNPSSENLQSETEKLIAECLKKNNIPFRFDYPLVLKTNSQKNEKRTGGLLSVIDTQFTVYTKFYCLNVRTREEFAWDIFPQIDLPENAKAAVQKLSDYNNSGFLSGKNLLITMETTDLPVAEAQIQQMITEYLI